MTSAKQSLRHEMKGKLKTLSVEDYERKSHALESNLLQYLVSLDHQFPLSVIGLFYSLRGEPLLKLERWGVFPWQLAYPSPLDDGMKYLLPVGARVEGGHWLKSGDDCTPDVIVVPGLAFSTAGYRVGRGAGFYDRMLSNWYPRLGCVGVCFEEQLCEDLVPQEHDKKLHIIITDLRILKCDA